MKENKKYIQVYDPVDDTLNFYSFKKEYYKINLKEKLMPENLKKIAGLLDVSENEILDMTLELTTHEKENMKRKINKIEDVWDKFVEIIKKWND